MWLEVRYGSDQWDLPRNPELLSDPFPRVGMLEDGGLHPVIEGLNGGHPEERKWPGISNGPADLIRNGEHHIVPSVGHGVRPIRGPIVALPHVVLRVDESCTRPGDQPGTDRWIRGMGVDDVDPMPANERSEAADPSNSSRTAKAIRGNPFSVKILDQRVLPREEVGHAVPEPIRVPMTDRAQHELLGATATESLDEDEDVLHIPP
jgi:hypothetical protein